MLVRSASFGRRAKPSHKAPERTNDTENEDSQSRSPTDSRSGTPERFIANEKAGFNFADEVEPPPIMTDRQFGWLQKKHHKGNGWAKRYFFVDETRGTLSYAKHPSRKKNPSAVLPIADITKLEPCEDNPCAFIIRCPPIHLTVAAVSAKERKTWMQQLELRAEVWRVKQAVKQPAASSHTIMCMANGARRVEVPREGDDKFEIDNGAGTGSSRSTSNSSSRAGSADASRDASRRPSDEELEARPAADEDQVKRATNARARREREAARKLAAEHEAESEAENKAEAEDALPPPPSMAPPPPLPPPPPPVEVAAEESVATPAATSRRAAKRSSAAAAAAKRESASSDCIETVELHSGDEGEDEDEGASSTGDVNSANRASSKAEESPEMRAPAPVPLGELISSDDENDDDEARETEREREIEEARERLRQAAAKPTVAEPAVAEPAVAEPPPADDDAGAGRADDDRAPSPSVERWEAPVVAADVDADERWDSDEEADEDLAPRAAVQGSQIVRPYEMGPPGLVVAPGIVADDNFADDDWDEDDE